MCAVQIHTDSLSDRTFPSIQAQRLTGLRPRVHPHVVITAHAAIGDRFTREDQLQAHWLLARWVVSVLGVRYYQLGKNHHVTRSNQNPAHSHTVEPTQTFMHLGSGLRAGTMKDGPIAGRHGP